MDHLLHDFDHVVWGKKEPRALRTVGAAGGEGSVVADVLARAQLQLSVDSALFESHLNGTGTDTDSFAPGVGDNSSVAAHAADDDQPRCLPEREGDKGREERERGREKEEEG